MLERKSAVTFCRTSAVEYLLGGLRCMSETLKRDQAAALAKLKSDEALAKARSIEDPWYRAQALAWVARFSPGNAVELAAEASRAARECGDVYKQVAVRAWEVAALAEAGHVSEAKVSLNGAIRDSTGITPVASKLRRFYCFCKPPRALVRVNETSYTTGSNASAPQIPIGAASER